MKASAARPTLLIPNPEAPGSCPRLNLACAVLLIAWSGAAAAAPGALDPAFGTNGRVVRDFFGNRDEARAVAVQPNGKIVVAGFARRGTEQGADSAFEDFAVLRYNEDGTPDSGFGVAGEALMDFGAQDRANAVMVQPGGRVVVAGGACTGELLDVCGFALVRYKRDGTPDTSFGAGGKVITHFPDRTALPFGLALQPDGMIVVAGWAFDGVGFDFALARYHGDGTLDADFGDAGLVITDLGADDFCLDVALQNDGKVVASGTTFTGATFDFALIRYEPDGTLDPTFGSGGIALTDFDSGDEEIRAIAVQADDKIVALGETFSASGVSFALARYEPDGALDADFGAGGLVTTDFGSGDAQGEALVVQPDGMILAAGGEVLAPDHDFQLARYDRDGTLDPSFGVDGLLATDFFGGRDRALAMALAPGGKIVLAGYAFNGVSRDFALARYLPR